MQKNIQNNENIIFLINTLEKSYLDNNLEKVEVFIEKISTHKDLQKNLDKLFMVLENNQEIDFWVPWNLIRLLESFYKKWYEEQLLLSLKRKVVFYTLWMLNRLINSSEWIIKDNYKDILKNIVYDKKNSLELINIWKEFLK